MRSWMAEIRMIPVEVEVLLRLQSVDHVSSLQRLRLQPQLVVVWWTNICQFVTQKEWRHHIHWVSHFVYAGCLCSVYLCRSRCCSSTDMADCSWVIRDEICLAIFSISRILAFPVSTASMVFLLFVFFSEYSWFCLDQSTSTTCSDPWWWDLLASYAGVLELLNMAWCTHIDFSEFILPISSLLNTSRGATPAISWVSRSAVFWDPPWTLPAAAACLAIWNQGCQPRVYHSSSWSVPCLGALRTTYWFSSCDFYGNNGIICCIRCLACWSWCPSTSFALYLCLIEYLVNHASLVEHLLSLLYFSSSPSQIDQYLAVPHWNILDPSICRRLLNEVADQGLDRSVWRLITSLVRTHNFWCLVLIGIEQ